MGLWKGDKVCLLTFGIVFNMFCSIWRKLDFEMEQQLFMSPTGLEYAIAVLLTNCYNCVYLSQVSKCIYAQCTGDDKNGDKNAF